MAEFERNQRASRFGWALAVALGVAPFGCLGGQTGQPTSADGSGGCTAQTVEVPVHRAVRGIVPIEAAQSFEGTYVQPLAWTDELGVPVANVAPDEITLTFTYDGGIARYNPCSDGGPDLEMTLDVVTRDSGLVESGTASVSLYPTEKPNGDFGSFTLGTPTSWLAGTLRRTEAGTTVLGALTTSALPLPLGNGRFPPP